MLKMKFEKQVSNLTSEDSFQMLSQGIEMFLRLKPKRDDENTVQDKTFTVLNPTTLIVKFPNSNSTRHVTQSRVRENASKKLKFTKIFKSDTSQVDIFEQFVESNISNFLCGQSSTIMTFGTTNSGKSYSLFGTNSNPGIIPQCIDYIFSVISCSSKPSFKPLHMNKVKRLKENDQVLEAETRTKLMTCRASSKRKLHLQDLATDPEVLDSETIYSIWLSFVEIYNESVYDLLADVDANGKKIRLKLVLDKNGSTFVNGLQMVYAISGLEAHHILTAAFSKLNVVASSLNQNSSRSHVIFTMKLLKYYKNCSPSDVKITTLTFCDLAGSGRLQEDLNSEKILNESRYINKSLLALGRCFKTIAENHGTKQNSDIVGPFRESCLTRLFQKILCEKEALSLLITLNTSPELYAETQNVLEVVSSIKKIVSNHSKNKQRSVDSVETTPVSRKTSNWDIISSSALSIKNLDDSEFRHRNEALIKELAMLKTTMFNREVEIRQEFANMYSNMLKKHDNEWTKRLEEIDKEREDLMKWSVCQVEKFYEERIENLTKRKRRKIDFGDYHDDEKTIIEALEAENTRITSKVISLREIIKELKHDREKAITEKNDYAFKLALTYEELKALKEFENQFSFSKGPTSNIELDELRKKLKEVETQVFEKENKIKMLQDELLAKHKKLDEVQSMCTTFETTRLDLYTTLEQVLQDKTMNNFVVKGEDSLMSKSKFSLFNAESIEVEESPKLMIRIPKERCSELSDGSNRWTVLESSVDKSDQNIRSSEANSKNDSGITMSSTSEISKVSSVDIQQRVEQLKEDYTILQNLHDKSTNRVLELSKELEIIKNDMRSLKENSAKNENKLIEYEKQFSLKENEVKQLNEEKSELQERYYQVAEDLKLKSQEYLTMMKELNERFKVREENETRTSKFIEEYLDKSISLESQLSLAQIQLENNFIRCSTEHVPKIEKLEKELSIKTIHIDELDDKISEVRNYLSKITQLNKKIDEFEHILENIKKQKEELHEQLKEKSENQFYLETKLSELTTVIQDKETKIKTLQQELESIIEVNAINNGRAKDLGEEMSKSFQKIAAIKEELLKSEEARINLERIMKQEIANFRSRLSVSKKSSTYVNFIQEKYKYKQLEVDRLKIQLEEKEEEICLIKRNRDSTIERYESLVQKLQLEAKEKEIGIEDPLCSKSEEFIQKLTYKSASNITFDPNLNSKETNELFSQSENSNISVISSSSSTSSMKSLESTEFVENEDSNNLPNDTCHIN